MLMYTLPFYGTIAYILLQPTNAVINETLNGYLFTIPDYPEYNRMSQSSANGWCQNNGNTLLEIYDSQLQGIVAQFINGKNGQYIYLGYNIQIYTNGMRNSTEFWMWVNGKLHAAGVSGVENQASSDYAYGYLTTNQSGVLYVADNQPTNKRGYICEVKDATANTCIGGFNLGDRCYTRSTDQLSWFGARNRCLDGGGDLASFSFVTDQQSLHSLYGFWINPSTSYWIGLRRQWWTWHSSGSEILYTNWQDGHPKPSPQSPQSPTNCLCLMPWQRDWSDCDCNQNYNFICVRSINDASTSTTTTSSIKSTPSNLTISSTSTASSIPVDKYTANPIQSSPTTGNETNNSLAVSLGVGLGVGLGGLLIIIIIIVVVVVLIRKRHHRKSGNSPVQKRLQTPDIINIQINIQQEDKYATVERKLDFDNVDPKANDIKTIYAVVQPTTNQTVL